MLHPEELTVGSLVITSKGDVIKVESISTKRQHRKVGYHAPNDPYRIKYVRLAQCSGIPVTVDFLKKNGFEDYELQNGYYILRNAKTDEFDNIWDLIVICDETTGMVEVRVSFGDDAVDYSFPDFKYVHELQRCMRCCGLYDLANNLKV